MICRTAESRLLLLSITLIEKNVKFFLEIGDRFTFLTMDKGRGDLAPTDCARKCLLNRRQVSERGDLAPTDCAFIGGRKYGRNRMRLPKPYFAFRHEHETACILILPP